jgi:hypothetical protein
MHRLQIASLLRVCTLVVLALPLPLPVQAQDNANAPSARESAALDMSGYWVAVVTEDWKFRMVTPNKGVYDGIPLNAAARRAADAWDPAANAGCKAYGAPAIMRVPTRLRIAWQDDRTLRIDTDAGRQTRLLHFAAAELPASAAPSLQGYSAASWKYAAGQNASNAALNEGGLTVVTTRLTPGYLRSNGVPYGENAELTEYFNVFDAPNGDQWLVVTSIVADPDYLSRTFHTSAHFKKLPDDAGWNPRDC